MSRVGIKQRYLVCFFGAIVTAVAVWFFAFHECRTKERSYWVPDVSNVPESFSLLTENELLQVLTAIMDESPDVCDRVVSYNYWGKFPDEDKSYYVSATCEEGHSFMVGFDTQGEPVGVLPCHFARTLGQACP